MRKYVAEMPPSSPPEYLDWFEAFELVPNELFYDCGRSDAQADDIVFDLTSSSIVTVSIGYEHTCYRHSFRWNSFEHKSVATWSAVATASWRQST